MEECFHIFKIVQMVPNRPTYYNYIVKTCEQETLESLGHCQASIRFCSVLNTPLDNRILLLLTFKF